MKTYIIQDCTEYELKFGLSGYTLEVFAESEADAMSKAKRLSRENAILSLIEVI